ncbi:MAG: hypothetical protein ACRDRL_32210 [Sciscionella sp.]
MDNRAAGPDLRSALAALDDGDEITVETGLTYRGSEPVLIQVRRRGHRYDIADNGVAVSLAGTPVGWLGRVERLVAIEGFNVNRRGVLFVPAVAGRDICSLAFRLAETSRQVYLTLLEAAAA